MKKGCRDFPLDLSNRLPDNLHDTIENATRLSLRIPGFLAENEIRFLGTLAACTPASGAIVEIGSFKGKSTVVLGTMAGKYGLGPVVAIDPHQGLSYSGPTPRNSLLPSMNFSLPSRLPDSTPMLRFAVRIHAMLREIGTGRSAFSGSMAIIRIKAARKILTSFHRILPKAPSSPSMTL